MLGLSFGANEDKIKKNFYELAKRYHPDSTDGLSEALIKHNEDKFKRISDAYDVLKD